MPRHLIASAGRSHRPNRAFTWIACALSAMALIASSPANATIDFGQVDDFQDGSTLGWLEGFTSPNPPTNVGGGTGGASDRILQNVSTGTGGSGSKQIMFNQAQWAGDYVTAGVTRLEMDLANPGPTDLSIRVAFNGGASNSRFASASPYFLPAGSGWTHAAFELSPTALASLGGLDTLNSVLGSVTELRVLSADAEFGPAYNGQDIAGTLRVDNIRALRRPGDATFDGFVNFDDLLALAKNFNQTTDRTWSQGDFDFDQDVDFNDLLTLAKNFNTGNPNASTAASLTAEFDANGVGGPAFSDEWTRARSLVPEPTLAMLLAGGPTVTACRRRRPPSG